MYKRISPNLIKPHFRNSLFYYSLLFVSNLDSGNTQINENNYYTFDITNSSDSNSTKIEFKDTYSRLHLSTIGVGAIASLSILSGLFCLIYIYSKCLNNSNHTLVQNEETKEEL